MAQSSPFFREDFQLKENHFALPEHSRELDPEKKRKLTICNLFVNHNLSISNLQRVLDEDAGTIVQALIAGGILYDRRQISGRPPFGIERRMASTRQETSAKYSRCGKTSEIYMSFQGRIVRIWDSTTEKSSKLWC